MKRQICTTLTGAAFASILLVLPQITSAADEADESAASSQAEGAAPAVEQLSLSEGKILEDKDNGKVVILKDPTADEITVERTSIVTPGEDGEVEVIKALIEKMKQEGKPIDWATVVLC